MDEGDKVSSELSAEEQSLKSLVEDSENALVGLEWDLSEVNRELDELANKNHQYELLSQICRSLEELENIGAAGLFWDSQSETREQYINGALGRISEYSGEIVRTEERREAILDKIGDQNQ